ncbi:uncharacterized protein RSE6_01436 [Rhynchosporium secalis]|uniref:Uncharacterized protein n=1 Tax=Rhynchosporium secalis TaxID=38038 RepID=A0A1E1LXT3_RHYSE|nr:uncharacterized protein RSE6_01436 [Rhynchosporium secalis]
MKAIESHRVKFPRLLFTNYNNRESRNIITEENLIKKTTPVVAITSIRALGILKKDTPFSTNRATKSGSWINDRATKTIRLVPETYDPGSRVPRIATATDTCCIYKKESY